MANVNLDLGTQLQERFAQLPEVVRNAITSADIEKRLRALADTNKLHLDQWEQLENEVMLTLMGFQPVESLQSNIQKEVGVPAQTAAALTAEVSRIVFEPIRQELERGLEHPEAQAKKMTGVESAREQALAGRAQQEIGEEKVEPAAPPSPPTPPVAPATPPPAAPTEKATRMPSSGAYKPGEASSARKDIHDDPYREPPA